MERERKRGVGGVCHALRGVLICERRDRMQVQPGAFTGIQDGISKIYAAEVCVCVCVCVCAAEA